MTKPATYETETHPCTVLVAVHAPYNKIDTIESYYEEFFNLVATNGLVYEEVFYVKLREISSKTFLTKGKLAELKHLCDQIGAEEVVFSEPLHALQEKNLSNYLGCAVFDRTQLILEIFEKHAHSAEGKAQVAIAMLQYKKSRVAGRGVHLSQQAGHIGTRGPGETLKEKELRHIETSILQHKSELKRLSKARETQRKQRVANRIPHICLIGYTNAGKSTILNALTKAQVNAEDKLFVTLDTTTRALYINDKQKGVISDTVGFIQQLPHSLIEAFKSTLSELSYADLLLLVVDISNKNWHDHITVVHKILDELEVDKEILYVFNKIDQVPEYLQALHKETRPYQPHVFVSAQSKEGLHPLISYVQRWEPL